MLFATTVNAICPFTGELKLYRGPNVEAMSFSDAYNVLAQEGIRYAKVELLVLSINGDETEKKKLFN